jgi:SAM-dependent methyltransferase
MTAGIYEKLSALYDLDWGQWPRRYTDLVQTLLEERGIVRARLLDLACGTGTLAVELTAHGHTVHGVDISPAMIEKANAKAAGRAGLSFEVGDLVSFTSERRFDGATCTFGSLNYVRSPERLRMALEGVARALAPGGFFLFDCNTDHLYSAHHHGTHRRELGGETFLQKLDFDAERRIATTTFVFSDGAEEVHEQRPYARNEIRPLVAGAGLTLARVTGGFDGRPYAEDSERLVCVVEKPV